MVRNGAAKSPDEATHQSKKASKEEPSAVDCTPWAKTYPFESKGTFSGNLRNSVDRIPQSGIRVGGTIVAVIHSALPGFLLSGFLLALLGAILPAWEYHRDPADFTAVGNYFLSLAVGI